MRRWKRRSTSIASRIRRRQLSALGKELRFLTITSVARVHEVTAAPDDAVAADSGNGVIPGVWLKVGRAGGTKCVRCWHWTEDVGTVADHPELCGRCAGNITGSPEERRHV